MKIKYLSDSDTDYECLELAIKNKEFGELADFWGKEAEEKNRLFIKAIQETNYLDSLLSKEELNGAREMFMQQTQELVLPTRYDDVGLYLLVEGLTNRIFKAAGELDLNTDNVPNFATLPTGEVNACATSLPCSDKQFLLFDSQLFTYCNLFAKVFSLCLPINNGDLSLEPKAIEEHIKSNGNQCVDRALDILVNYCDNNRPGSSEAYLPPREYLGMNTTLRDGMELFIVGHEYGHYFSGHLASDLHKALRAISAEGDISDSHQEEFEADLLGALLSLHALTDSGVNGAIAYASIELFFTSMMMCARYENYKLGVKDEHFQEEENESHPQFLERKFFLRATLLEMEGIKEHSEQIEQVYTLFDNIYELLWQEVLSKLNVEKG